MIFILQMRETKSQLSSQSTWLAPEGAQGGVSSEPFSLAAASIHPSPDQAVWAHVPGG